MKRYAIDTENLIEYAFYGEEGQSFMKYYKTLLIYISQDSIETYAADGDLLLAIF